MRKPLLFVLLLAVIVAIPSGVTSSNSATDENVFVFSEYLTDSDGYNYGANYFLSSTVNDQTCATPYVVSQENANGSVASPALLNANESRFSIGSFRVADDSKAWKVIVRAKWKRGTC